MDAVIEALLKEAQEIRALLERGPASPWLTYEGAMDYLQVCRTTLQRWVSLGVVRSSKVGSVVRFRREWLDAVLEDQALGGVHPPESPLEGGLAPDARDMAVGK